LSMRVKDVGDTAFSVEFDDNAGVQALRRALRGPSPLPGLVEVVPGLTSLLVGFDPRMTSREEMEARVRALTVGTGSSPAEAGRLWRIAVRYDGPDLDAVAAASGLSVDEVIARHSGTRYTVLMLGFMPGFAYMGGLDASLRIPRRTEPRLKVPAGSLAIADDMTAIYPWESPGGWHLLGSTEINLFDANRQPPALLAAGDRVEFVVG
jgi:KipI family sensor histidine kinase inhibitor